jgi:hypothetical protein
MNEREAETPGEEIGVSSEDQSTGRDLVSSEAVPYARSGDPTRLPVVVPISFGPGKHGGVGSRSWTVPVSVAAVATLAIALAGVTILAFNDHVRQSDLIAKHAEQAESFSKTVDALTARLTAVESAKSHDDLIDLRRSVGELKSSAATSRELSGALAQLSQRVERLDRDGAVKVEKLGERVDHETSSRTAELAARIEKLEKKGNAVAGQTAGPAVPAASSTKQPSPPKLAGDISMETTGSIARRRPLLRGYVVLGARDEVALIAGRNGERAVRPGDYLPGAGRVERIERQDGNWVVRTDQGLITAAEMQPD